MQEDMHGSPIVLESCGRLLTLKHPLRRLPQGAPAEVVCGPAEDCGVALALAGALALQRTILALSGVGGLLRSVSAAEASPTVRQGVSLWLVYCSQDHQVSKPRRLASSGRASACNLPVHGLARGRRATALTTNGQPNYPTLNHVVQSISTFIWLRMHVSFVPKLTTAAAEGAGGLQAAVGGPAVQPGARAHELPARPAVHPAAPLPRWLGQPRRFVGHVLARADPQPAGAARAADAAACRVRRYLVFMAVHPVICRGTSVKAHLWQDVTFQSRLVVRGSVGLQVVMLSQAEWTPPYAGPCTAPHEGPLWAGPAADQPQRRQQLRLLVRRGAVGCAPKVHCSSSCMWSFGQITVCAMIHPHRWSACRQFPAPPRPAQCFYMHIVDAVHWRSSCSMPAHHLLRPGKIHRVHAAVAPTSLVGGGTVRLNPES
jgi:hypothetical protein